MAERRANQLVLGWQDGKNPIPKAVEEEVRALVAQLLRAVVAAEHGAGEADDE